MDRRFFIAITGASGAVYARRLVEAVSDCYSRIYLCASENSVQILRDELAVSGLGDLIPDEFRDRFVLVDPCDMYAPPASGSHDYEAMVVVPCSMGTAGRIASGVSNDLITRAADVCLKERRKLVLVVRESPFSLIHLENLTRLAQAGAVVMPASPAFYQNPETVDDLVDFVVDRILRQLGVDKRLIKGWKSDE